LAACRSTRANLLAAAPARRIGNGPSKPIDRLGNRNARGRSPDVSRDSTTASEAIRLGAERMATLRGVVTKDATLMHFALTARRGLGRRFGFAIVAGCGSCKR
jgi:hypothetical protein